MEHGEYKVGEEFRSWIEGLTFLILSAIYECLCVFWE